MKKSNKAKRAGKTGKPAKKDYELTYFLDHPQIQRHECVGNQDPKPSSNSPFAHVGQAAGHTKERGDQIKEAQTKSDQSRTVSGALGNLKKNLGF
jgi:hypothetical protein